MGEPIFINANEQVWVSPEYWELVQKEMKAIQSVRELHKSIKVDTMDFNVCLICDKYYPCDTIKVLDGEQ